MKKIFIIIMMAVLSFTTVTLASGNEDTKKKESKIENTDEKAYLDQEEFMESVQALCSGDAEEIFGKLLNDELGSGHHLAQLMQYTLEYLDKYRHGRFEDSNFQKLADLYLGSAQVLASSDIFGEEDPMNYALVEYGMKSHIIAEALMADYFGLEIAESDKTQMRAVIDQIFEDYSLDDSEQESVKE